MRRPTWKGVRADAPWGGVPRLTATHTHRDAQCVPPLPTAGQTQAPDQVGRPLGTSGWRTTSPAWSPSQLEWLEWAVPPLSRQDPDRVLVFITVAWSVSGPQEERECGGHLVFPIRFSAAHYPGVALLWLESSVHRTGLRVDVWLVQQVTRTIAEPFPRFILIYTIVVVSLTTPFRCAVLLGNQVCK